MSDKTRHRRSLASGSRSSRRLLATRLIEAGVVSLGFLLVGSGLGLSTAIAPSASSTPKSCPVGSLPQLPTYDSARKWVYVPNYGSPRRGNGNVTILRGKCDLVASVRTGGGSCPSGAAYDPRSGIVYVTDSCRDVVYLLNGTRVTSTLAGRWFSNPAGIAYDPSDGEMAVAEQTANNVTLINGTTVVGSVPTPSLPNVVSFDPGANSLLIADVSSNSLTIVSNASSPIGSPETNVSLPKSGVGAAAYDPLDGLIYVYDGPRLLLLQANGSVAYNLRLASGGGGGGLAYSPADGRMYVALGTSGRVAEFLNETLVRTISISGTVPHGLVYDAATGSVYMVDDATDRAYLLK